MEEDIDEGGRCWRQACCAEPDDGVGRVCMPENKGADLVGQCEEGEVVRLVCCRGLIGTSATSELT